MGKTKFAPAKRASMTAVMEEYNFIRDKETILKVLDSLPYVITILNEHRQILYSNPVLLNIMGIPSLDVILGNRLGEAVSCIYSKLEDGGCGTSKHCSVCGAIRTLMACQKTKKMVTDECRITSKIEGELINFDLEVSASPFHVEGREYILMSLNDISQKKRKEMLERVFFHDILNITGNLKGFVDLFVTTRKKEKVTEYSEYIESLTSKLIDEIYAQRQLMSAERGELIVKPERLSVKEILNNAKNNTIHHEVAENKTIIVEKVSEDTFLEVDGQIINRVLVNMIKNAFEAVPEGSIIKIGYEPVPKGSKFWVFNEGEIPHDVQLQLFQRSFSTKNAGRGLGTFSMKLFGEKYLKGKVDFESGENGTTFFLVIPG
jgi:hypothetical protein